MTLPPKDDLTQLKEDVAAIRNAVIGPTLNGVIVGKGILYRLDRLEKAVIALIVMVVTILGVTGGGTILDWLKNL